MLVQKTKEQRIVLWALGGLACIVALVWLSVLLFGQAFANSILAGEGPFSYLRNYGVRLVGSFPPENRAAELLALFRAYLGRLTVVYLFCQTLVLFASQRYQNLFHDFFHAKTHPINLAVFRIAFFVTLYPRPSLRKILGLLELPDSSRVAPPGLDWWVANLPESSDLNTWLYRLFIVACVCGTIGLATRWACALAAVLTLYLMGITQFFGKIEHQHHLVWIACLLAASRCGDALSIDAWLRKKRAKQQGTESLVQPSRAYALPLRFVWLFLGVMYFFPGLWKFVVSGPAWFLSQNLESRMLLRQFVGEGWQLPFPIYEYPTLCTLGGLVTILMEVGFVFLILLPGWRYLAAAGGFSFHWLVQWFLNISFWPVPIYYASFVDWQGLWNRMRGLASTQSSDQPQPSSVQDATPAASLNASHETEAPSREHKVRSVFAVGSIFLAVNIACGFVMLDSWPFGVYPTFARIVGPTFSSISFRPVDASGQELQEVEALFDPAIREAYGVGIGRLGEILGTTARPSSQRAERLQNLWDELRERQSDPNLDQVTSVNFYLVEYSTRPRDGKKPIKRTMIESLQR